MSEDSVRRIVEEIAAISHKTRQERADFLRRFFRDLKQKAGFKTVADLSDFSAGS